MAGITFEGILRIRETPPEWTDEDVKKWWCDEYTESGVYVRKARMSRREKDRYTVLEAKNEIMTAGYTAILTYLGNFASNATSFALKYAIGTGNIYTVTPADTTLSGETFRKTPTGSSVSGNQVDITTSLAAGDAVSTWTNVGLFGSGATGTANSGTLNTHLLLSYIKTNAARTADYAITAQ